MPSTFAGRVSAAAMTVTTAVTVVVAVAAGVAAPPAAADPGDGYRVVAEVPLGARPGDVATDPSAQVAYVGLYDASAVAVVDTTTDTVTATVPLDAPGPLAVDTSTHLLYVVVGRDHPATTAVAVVDGATRTVLATVPLPRRFPTAIDVDPTTHTVYVANVDATVSVIDGAAFTLVTTVTSGASFLEGIAVDPTTHTVYAASYPDRNVVVLDGATNTVATRIALPRGPVAIAVDPTTHTVYAGSDDGFVVVDGTSGAVVRDSSAVAPNDLAVDPTRHVVYAATDYALVVLDGSGRSLTAVGLDATPEAVAVDPVTSRGYVSRFYSTDLTVIAPPAPAAAQIGGMPPDGAVGQRYRYTFTVDGTPAPTVDLAAGALPPGRHLNVAGGLIGIPTTEGRYTFTVRATNEQGTATEQVTVRIRLATRTSVTAEHPRVDVGEPVTFTATVTPNPGGGRVAFRLVDGKDLTDVLCAGAPVGLDGTARCVVPEGFARSVQVAAVYSGNPTYAASTSAKITLIVR